jgi:hypothetical protein
MFSLIFGDVWRKPDGPINFRARHGNTAPTSRRSECSEQPGLLLDDIRKFFGEVMAP